MTLIDRLTRWTWQRDWRTWLAHGVLCLSFTLGVALLGGGVIGFLGSVSYYAGREKLLEGGVYSRDRIMDAVSAGIGGATGLLLWGILR